MTCGRDILLLQTTQTALHERLTQLRARIQAACERAGRNAAQVEILPVSKTFPVTAIEAAMALGLRRFGENRPQELAQKAQALQDKAVQWVAIGQVQSNKAREVARWATQVQSLDRPSLARALQRRLEPLDRTLEVLVQVKTSPETTKSGLEPAEVVPFLRTLKDYPNLKLRGLMTMAVFSDD